MTSVLIIDADPAVRLLARRVLEAAGFTVLAVTDAAVALVLLAGLRVDLVISDIDSLVSDGKLAVTIADVDPPAQTMALFPKHQNNAVMERYARHALGKPFTPSEFLMKVRRALSDKRRVSAGPNPAVSQREDWPDEDPKSRRTALLE